MLQALKVMVERELIDRPFGKKALPPAVCYAAPRRIVGQGNKRVEIQSGDYLFGRTINAANYYLKAAEDAIVETYPMVFKEIFSRSVCAELGYGNGDDTVNFLIKTGLAINTASAFQSTLNNDMDSDMRYIGIDIAEVHRQEATPKLAAIMPENNFRLIEADFLGPDFWNLNIWKDNFFAGRGLRKVGFFPGSTIGNLRDRERDNLLKGARKRFDEMLVGVDSTTGPPIFCAYGAAAEKTAKEFWTRGLSFGLANAGWDVPLSIADKFKYDMRFNAETRDVEIRLVSMEYQEYRRLPEEKSSLTLKGPHMEFMTPRTIASLERYRDRKFVVEEGEEIFCIRSNKSSVEKWIGQFRKAGWNINRIISYAGTNDNPSALRPFVDDAYNAAVDYNYYHLT